MKRFWLRSSVKKAGYIIQGLLAGLLVLCLISINRWMEGDFSLSELSVSFENTDLFYQTVEDIVREKIEYDQNIELFEYDGDFDENKQIDIRQYASGSLDSASSNRYTTYTIGDLLSFGNGDASTLQDTIYDLEQQNYSEEEIGNLLDARSASLETIIPLSGVTLSEYSRMSANPSVTLLEYYRELCDTSLDLADRYASYAGGESAQNSSKAPSNVAYYVENTNTKQYYSNIGATSLLTAQFLVSSSSDLTYIFEGERRLNIMVANTDHVYSEKASNWFMKTRFVGGGERVLIAVNLSYSVGDRLQEESVSFRQREPLLWICLFTAAVCAALLVLLFIHSAMTAGRNEAGKVMALGAFDQLPTEIAVGICVILAIIWWMLGRRFIRARSGQALVSRLGMPVLCSVEYWIILSCIMSVIRRFKAGSLWKDSVCYYVVLGTRQVYSARRSSRWLLIVYVGFVALNMAFLLIGGIAGVVMMLVLNMAALLYLMRDNVGNQNVREGLRQISTGKLDYRINTDVLTGESREMGLAVNEMGDGLEKAVDSMLAGERLKAELITNVSHDLKTPLTSIINYVDLLKRLDLQDERAADYIDVLDRKTQRLRQLTEDLIEVSKISSGNIELHPETMQPRMLLMQACGEYEDRLEEAGLRLKMDLSREKLWIRADGARLWRVFENLLGNIAKYAKPQTQVQVSLVREGDSARICFENVSASKITANAQQLKERFTRGDESRSRTEGFGLGLSIADSLTSMMGGTFSVVVILGEDAPAQEPSPAVPEAEDALQGFSPEEPAEDGMRESAAADGRDKPEMPQAEPGMEDDVQETAADAAAEETQGQATAEMADVDPQQQEPLTGPAEDDEEEAPDHFLAILYFPLVSGPEGETQ